MSLMFTVDGPLPCHWKEPLHVSFIPLYYDCKVSPRFVNRSSLTLESGEPEPPTPPFKVSQPASNAEYGQCVIENAEPKQSEWKAGNNSWVLYRKNVSGTALLPVHETCITIVRNIAGFHSQNRAHARNPKFSSLQGYYEALLRLYDRLTEWPFEQPELEDQLCSIYLEPTIYGSTKLEWEHQYYVLNPFTVIDDWLARNGPPDECWEVRKTPELKSLLRSRLYTLTSVSGYIMILLGSQH